MASHAAALTSPAKQQIAKALAAAEPAELSQSPLLGILGVVLGAAIVTLTGRMLTLGLADLRGGLGISFDQGAWTGSAFNVALMFIGPLTVYFGALLGTRQVLLGSALLFTLICLGLPFVHSYSLLITGLVLAGLTSGTFYPLTLTFALRNIPPRYLVLTLALYATFVDQAVNFAPTMYGWYRDHFSFHWMFWNSALLTPFMMYCIYFGIPKTPPPRKSGATPSFQGFLYASAGFALLFAALDQGQRLDWWRSGLFNGLFFGAVVFLTASLVRRMSMPNPLIDLPYLRQWNTVLLGIGLMLFRFCLLATIILIPQSLAIHGFEASEYASAVFWTAAPQLVVAIIAALLLLSGVDSRLILAAGFACMAAASLLNAQYTLAWSAADYYRSELLMAVGQSFAFVGLVSTIVLQAVFSGGLSRPQDTLTFSAFFHTIRLLGGEIGVTFMVRYIAVREELHSNLLGLHVQHGNWLDDAALRQMAAGLYAKSSGLPASAMRAAGLLAGRVRLQAYALTFIDGFRLIAWACVIALLLIALLRTFPMNYHELSFPEELSPAPGEKS